MTIDTVRGHRRTLRWPFASGSFDMTRPLTLALGASLLGATMLAGCATTAQTGGAQAGSAGDPYPSTYAPIASPPVLISGATVLTGTGTRLDGTDVLLQDGKVRSEENTSELQSIMSTM